MTTHITPEQARQVLRQQALAQSTLTGYARYIDIPGVPDDGDVDDRIHTVVETPLAPHHIFLLNCLQLLVDGLLVYDPQVLDSPIDFGVLRGDERPVGVRSDGGVGNGYVYAPSPKSKIPHSHTFKNPNMSQTYSHGALREIQVMVGGVLNGRIAPHDAMSVIARHHPELVSCKRVMVMLPPGSAKSTYASVVFPTWVMGKVKAFETILTGWGDPICRRHGKRARQICASPAYNALFGTGLDPNTKAAEDWALANSSSYKSSGINSGVAGFRTNGLIWDDLTKNRKEADSETIRNDVYNAYIDDARSRKTPSAWEVGIGTRWHEDEIMGRILPEGYNGESGFIRCRDGNVWFVVCMAAECERNPDEDPLGREKGEMIWPEWFTEEYWAEKRVNARSWGSLYQQRPAPESGIVFKREKFKWYTDLPEGENYISYDPGVSDVGDETAMHVWRVDDAARVYLVKTFYEKCSMDVWIKELVNNVKIHRPLECISESGVIRRAAEPFIKRAMRTTKTFFNQVWVTRSANKQAMAAPALAMVNSGQVYLPKNSDGERFLDACLKFPASKDDHEIDSFANLCLRLEHIFEAAPPLEKEEKVVVISGEIPVKSLMPPRFSKKKSRWEYKRAG